MLYQYGNGFNKRCDMEPRRLGVGRAAIALVVVVVIVGAIGLVVAGPRSRGSTTVFSTDSWPIVVRDHSLARFDPETGLSLDLNLTANPNGTIIISAYDFNTLDRPNNVTTATDWPVPIAPCGLVDYVVYQGDYSTTNYTQGTPLYTGGNVPTCLPTSYFIFSPLSSEGILHAPPTVVNTLPLNASISETLSGYVIGGNSTNPLTALVPFPLGTYTVAAEDEWGNIVTSQFRVTTPCCATATTFGVLTTLTQNQVACEGESTACIELYGWAFVYANSTVILDTATNQDPATTELNITFSGLPSNSGFTGSVNLDQVLFPRCSCPFDEQFVHSPVLSNLKQGDEVKVTITGTSGLLFTATFTI
jgi:hypothetical protein